MTNTMRAIAAATITLLSASAAHATQTGGATSVPEPTDAVLLLMGAAGVILGRHLHARKNKKPD